MLHALMQDFYRRPHRAYHAAANNPLRQLQVMKAEQVDPFVEIEQALGHVVQTEEFPVAAVELIHVEVDLAQLGVESLTQARTNMEQGKETGRIQTAAMSEPGTDQVIVVGRDSLQNVQHGDRIFQHVVAAAQELGRV